MSEPKQDEIETVARAIAKAWFPNQDWEALTGGGRKDALIAARAAIAAMRPPPPPKRVPVQMIAGEGGCVYTLCADGSRFYGYLRDDCSFHEFRLPDVPQDGEAGS